MYCPKTFAGMTVIYGCIIIENMIYLHGLGVFENRGLREMFGPTRQNITVGWRNLHDKFHYTHQI
jgi:3-hydroxymyristoyl/3-hydroxydecanoyl-(acyl carrier protein) dehydratase